MAIPLKKWPAFQKQFAEFGGKRWSVERLIELSKNFPVMEIPLEHLCIFSEYASLNLLDMCAHVVAVNDADLEYPIILDEQGVILDGRHRVMKALIQGHKTIKAVRFFENPEPCSG